MSRVAATKAIDAIKSAQQMFEKEIVLTDKQILRNRLITEKDKMKEVLFEYFVVQTCIYFILA